MVDSPSKKKFCVVGSLECVDCALHSEHLQLSLHSEHLGSKLHHQTWTKAYPPNAYNAIFCCAQFDRPDENLKSSGAFRAFMVTVDQVCFYGHRHYWERCRSLADKVAAATRMLTWTSHRYGPQVLQGTPSAYEIHQVVAGIQAKILTWKEIQLHQVGFFFVKAHHQLFFNQIWTLEKTADSRRIRNWVKLQGVWFQESTWWAQGVGRMEERKGKM